MNFIGINISVLWGRKIPSVAALYYKRANTELLCHQIEAKTDSERKHKWTILCKLMKKKKWNRLCCFWFWHCLPFVISEHRRRVHRPCTWQLSHRSNRWQTWWAEQSVAFKREAVACRAIQIRHSRYHCHGRRLSNGQFRCGYIDYVKFANLITLVTILLELKLWIKLKSNQYLCIVFIQYDRAIHFWIITWPEFQSIKIY